jgi:hypothetical protein
LSTLATRAYHPINGSVEEIWEGFSWPCLFCGFLWYMYKGMWGWGIITLSLAFLSFWSLVIDIPFFANEQYARVRLIAVEVLKFANRMSMLSYKSNPSNFKAEQRCQRRLVPLPSTKKPITSGERAE